MTPQQAENEDNARLRKARDHIAHCQAKEHETRAALAIATADTRRAREKHSDLFAECERRAVARRLSGQIVNNPGY